MSKPVLNCSKNQIKRDFNFEDMPEKAEEALVAARRDAEQTVAMYQGDPGQGNAPPSLIFLSRAKGARHCGPPLYRALQFAK